MIHRIKRTTLLLLLIFVSKTVESAAIRDTIQTKHKFSTVDREIIDDESDYERNLAKTKKTKAPTTVPPPKTKNPVRIPSHPPSISSHPSNSPYPTLSRSPSDQPSISSQPTSIPSQVPSQVPSLSSSPTISAIPTKTPSYSPSTTPTFTPSLLPSISPSQKPSLIPSYKPSNVPTKSRSPSSRPSFKPSNIPTKLPSANPTKLPSHSPSKSPSITPSFKPSYIPSQHPTSSPSYNPTDSPSYNPTTHPTDSPSIKPSHYPTQSPTLNPTLSVEPTNKPTISHEPTLVVIQEIDLIKFNFKIYFDMTQTPQGRHTRRLRLEGLGNDSNVNQRISSEQDVSSSFSRRLDSISINEDVLFKKLYQVLNDAYGNNFQYYSDVGLTMEYEQSTFEDIYMVVTYLIGGTISFAVSNFKFIPPDDKVLSVALDVLNDQIPSLNALASASSEPISMVKAEEVFEPSSNNSNKGTIVEGTGSQVKVSTITIIACSVAAVSTVIAYGLIIMHRRRVAEESDEEYEPAEPATSPPGLGALSPTALNRLNPLNILSISPTSNSLDTNNKSRRYFQRLKSDNPNEGKSKSKHKYPSFITTHDNFSDEESSLEAPSGVDLSLQGDSEIDSHTLANMSALDEVRLNAALNIPDETSIDSSRFTGGSRTTLTSFSRVWGRRKDHSNSAASFPTQCANISPRRKIIQTEIMRHNDMDHNSDFSSPRFAVKSPITPGDYSTSTFETPENVEIANHETRSRLESRCSLDLAKEYDHFNDSLYKTDNSSVGGDNVSVSDSDDSMILLAKLSTGTPHDTTPRNQNLSKVYYGDNEEELSISSNGDDSVCILADDDASNQSNHSDTSVQAKLAHEMYVQSLQMVQDGLNGSRISSEEGSVSSVDAGRLINETSLASLGDNDDMYATMILKTNISMNMIKDMESNSKDTDHDTDSKTNSSALEAVHGNPSNLTQSVLTHEDMTTIYKIDSSFNNSSEQNKTNDLRMETMSFESPINRITNEEGENIDVRSETSYEYVGEANVSSPEKYDSCLENSLNDSSLSGTTECHNNLTLPGDKDVSKTTDYVKEQMCESNILSVADGSNLLDSVANHDLKNDNDDLISLEEDDDDILLSEDEESASENNDVGTNDNENDDMIPNTQDHTKQSMNNSVNNNLSTQVVINDSLRSDENNQDVECDDYVGNMDDDMYENSIVAMNETTCAVVDMSIRSESYKLLVDNVESYIIDEKSKKIPE